MANEQIVIKRVEEEHAHVHHGGGWKVAYADFMTAMMAFFLMLWILAASDDEKLRGLADYFTPANAENGAHGEGILRGSILGPSGVQTGIEGPPTDIRLPSFGSEDPLTAFDSRIEPEVKVIVEYEPAPVGERTDRAPAEPRQVVDGQPTDQPTDQLQLAHRQVQAGENAEPSDEVQLTRAREHRERLLEGLEQDIHNAIMNRPELREMISNIRFERVPEGLHVQILDQEGRSMFSSGSSRIEPHARELITVVGRAVSDLALPITIAGHTDSVPFTRASGYSNWELSTDRANATRRVLVGTGVSPARLRSVTGLADTAPLVSTAPEAPQNRRIDILLVYPEIASAGR